MDLESLSKGTAALYELALRLIPREYPPGTPYEAPARIWAGSIPEDLAIALPVPENARVIGTYGAPRLLTILVDTDMSPKDVLGFYRERFEGHGLEDAPDSRWWRLSPPNRPYARIKSGKDTVGEFGQLR